MADYSGIRSGSPAREGRVSDQISHKCPKCNHYIQAGSVEVEGVNYHPKCFVCMKCGTTCRLGNYQRVNNKFYCQNCCDKTPELYNSIRAAKQKIIDDEKARLQAIIDEENARKQAIIDAEIAERERQQRLIDAENERIAAELEAKKQRSFMNMLKPKSRDPSPSKNSPEKPKIVASQEKPSTSQQKVASPDKPKKSPSQQISKQPSQQISKQPSQQIKKSPSKQISSPPPPPIVEEPAAAADDIWVEVKDENTGKIYWWNQESNETTALDAPKPVGYTARPPVNQSAGCGCIIN